MSPEAEGRAAATRFRREHRLGTHPLGDLVTLIVQTTGIDVAVLDASSDDHGLTMRDPDRDTIVIGVSRTRDSMRQRTALAHELGHAMVEDWTRRSAAGEKRADAFARHLLLPGDSLRDFVGKDRPADQATLSGIVQRFLVPPAIAAIALHQEGHIATATKKEWLELTTATVAARFGWSDYYQSLQNNSDHRRAPQRLLARALKGYAEGLLSPQSIGTLRGISAREAEAEMRDAGIVPVEHPIPWGSADDLPAVPMDLAALDDGLTGPTF